MFLNLGGEFINFECRDSWGKTMLLRCSVGNGYGLNPYNIKLLIDRGANVMARDIEGNTCLHLAIKSVRSRGRVLDKTSLLFMVKAGADVYATNHYGYSVSDIAYTSIGTYRSSNLGTYVGDLWDEVLTECGYDAARFREDFRRRHPDELAQELGQASDSDERELMSQEQDSEIAGHDSDNTEKPCHVPMEDAYFQCNSSSPPGDGLNLSGIEEIFGANVWSQMDPMPEDSFSGLFSSVDNQHILPPIDYAFDYNME